jgi:hypothetical protein
MSNTSAVATSIQAVSPAEIVASWALAAPAAVRPARPTAHADVPFAARRSAPSPRTRIRIVVSPGEVIPTVDATRNGSIVYVTGAVL